MPDDERAGTRRKSRTIAGLLAAGIAVAAFVAGGVALFAPDRIPGFPGGHGGGEVAEPSAEAAEEGLEAATRELHEHTNWLVWGPGSSAHPAFSVLADETVASAEDEGADRVAELVAEARELLLQEGEARAAHDKLQEAERRASRGQNGTVGSPPGVDPGLE